MLSSVNADDQKDSYATALVIGCVLIVVAFVCQLTAHFLLWLAR